VTTKQTQENISNSEAVVSETMNFDISQQYSRAEIWAWTSKIRRRRRRPPSEMAPRPARALKLSAASIGHRFFSAKFPDSRMGRMTNSGTTAISWRRRIPRVAEPKRVGSSPFSASSCSTKADEDNDSAAPMTTASSTVLIFTCAHTAALTLYHMYSSSFVHSPASFTFSYRRWEPGQTKKREPWLKYGDELEHLWRDSLRV
jgi:hypothetical protein